MDEVTRLRMRRAHADRSVVCACGRRLFGNGRAAHQRTCEAHLEQSGWPLDDGMQQAIFDEYRGRGASVVRGVQHRLGRFYLDRRRAGDRTTLSWPEFRDLVWRYADEADAQR